MQMDAADAARIIAAILGEYAQQTRHFRADIMQASVPDSKMETTIPLPAAVMQTLYGKIQTHAVPVKTVQLPHKKLIKVKKT